MTFDTDKVTHGYLPTYLQIASEVGTAGRICEVGVWQGGSLAMWQTLFPDGLVVGVDVTDAPPRSWPAGTHKVVASQDDPGLPATLRGIADGFDLVVDDATHAGALTRRTFELLWPLVAPGGWYVIEDWMISLEPDKPFADGGEMLEAVGSLLRLLTADSDVASVEYRYGLAIARKT